MKKGKRLQEVGWKRGNEVDPNVAKGVIDEAFKVEQTKATNYENVTELTIVISLTNEAMEKLNTPVKEPKCSLCQDTGIISYGGSFGGPTQTQKCPCQK